MPAVAVPLPTHWDGLLEATSELRRVKVAPLFVRMPPVPPPAPGTFPGPPTPVTLDAIVTCVRVACAPP